jgi:hypothetical protein
MIMSGGKQGGRSFMQFEVSHTRKQMESKKDLIFVQWGVCVHTKNKRVGG